MGPHQFRPQRAVDPHAEQFGVLDGDREGLQGLAGEGPAAAVGDRHGDHHRQAPPGGLEALLDGEQAGLEVEGVEDGLGQQKVDAPFDQGGDLLAVGRGELVEGDRPVVRVVGIGGEGGGAVGGPDRAGHEAGPVPAALGDRPPRAGRRSEVDRPHMASQTVVGQRDAVGVEGVGREHLRAGLKVAPVDGHDGLGLGEREKVVAALQIMGMIGQLGAAISRLVQAELLDRRSHRAIQQEDPPGGELGQLSRDLVRCGFHRGVWRGSEAVIQ